MRSLWPCSDSSATLSFPSQLEWKIRCPWNFPGKIIGVGCQSLPQGIFLTHGWKLGLQHCRQTHYRLSHQGRLYLYTYILAQMVKHLPTIRETLVRSLAREDPLEKEMANHSSTLAWKIPWTEEPGRLQSMGSERVGHV